MIAYLVYFLYSAYWLLNMAVKILLLSVYYVILYY